MQIEHRVVGDVVVIVVLGDITSANGGADILKEKIQNLLHQGHRKLLLDLSKVPYVDSAGLGQLVQIYAMTSRMGGSLKLLNLTKQFNDLLSLTKLLSWFDRPDHRSSELPKHTGLVCPACREPVAVVEYEAPAAITFHCPACDHRWNGDAPSPPDQF